jgi:DTW domain-containing protein
VVTANDFAGYRQAVKQRLRKTADPCPKCGLHRKLCLCELIPRLVLKTHVTLLVHAKELKRTTNTGTLALHALVNSDMFVRGTMPGAGGRIPNLAGRLLEGYRPLLFFTADDAVEMTESFARSLGAPAQLLVPDGNWRQASKVHSRHPELLDVPRVKISTPNLGQLHLRAEHTVEGMATLEAIAKAIGLLESREAETALLALYREKLERTTIGRQGRIDQSIYGKNKG